MAVGGLTEALNTSPGLVPHVWGVDAVSMATKSIYQVENPSEKGFRTTDYQCSQ